MRELRRGFWLGLLAGGVVALGMATYMRPNRSPQRRWLRRSRMVGSQAGRWLRESTEAAGQVISKTFR